MNSIERLVWVVLVILLGILYLNERQEVNNVYKWVLKQNEQLVELDSLLSVVIDDVDFIVSETEHSDWILESELRYLLEQGLSDPISDIKEDLMNRKDLIAQKGILGGVMGIYRTDQIRILPGGYVYALYEDGHIRGNLILHYEVKNGQISWDLIKSSLF